MLLCEWEWLVSGRLNARTSLTRTDNELQQWLNLLRCELQSRSLSPICSPGPLQTHCHAWDTSQIPRSVGSGHSTEL